MTLIEAVCGCGRRADASNFAAIDVWRDHLRRHAITPAEQHYSWWVEQDGIPMDRKPAKTARDD